MDKADHMEALMTGGFDSLSRRAHARMQEERELPITTDKTDEILVRLGFVLGGPSDRKNFRRATLPAGWSIKRSDHHMYSHVLDEKGRRRAQIGYSAQDGWASFGLERRFDPSFTKDDWGEQDDADGASVVACIQDSDKKELWRGPRIPDVDKKKNPNWFNEPSALDKAREIAEKKLDELAPNWSSVEAYWGADGDAIVWPEHETPVDTRELYVLMTSCYDAGSNYRDGGQHASRKAKDDKEAKKRLLPALGSLISYYHEVRWSIRCGERVVESGTEKKPSPRPSRRDRTGFMFLRGPNGEIVKEIGDYPCLDYPEGFDER